MATWTTFDSDSDVSKCNRPNSSKQAKHLSTVTDNKQDGFKRYSALEDSPAKQEQWYKQQSDDENCISLPVSDLSPHFRSIGRASIPKSASSCENLDTRCHQVHTGYDNKFQGGGSNLYKASSDNPVYGLAGSAPPVPPRDYVSNKSVPRLAEIHPIVQNGQQLTHTHYWLLPDKVSRKLEDLSDENGLPESYINVAHSTPTSTEISATKNSQLSTANFGSPISHLGIVRKVAGLNSLGGSDTIHLLSDEADLDTASVDLPCDTGDSISGEQLFTKSRSDKSDLSSVMLDSRQGVMPMKNVNDLVQEVKSLVEGVTVDESYTALSIHSWNVKPAVRYLKIEHLFRLGIASRSRCQTLLERHDWDIEQAASDMLDQITSGQKATIASLNQSSAAKPFPSTTVQDLSKPNLPTSQSASSANERGAKM